MANKYLIYSLEDDENISRIINLALSKQDYEVKSFLNYNDFINEFNTKKPNMILLDLMLPEISGEEILKNIRKDVNNDDIQIIIISAKNLAINKVDGLDLGADDYIAKPFDILELISRVNAHSRRFLKKEESKIRDLFFDKKHNSIFKQEKEIHFTNGELVILFKLFENKGEAVSRDELFVALWGKEQEYETRILDMHVKDIRKKLKDDSDLIETVYGFGYRMKNE